jgi:aminoglycoside phosphotransferase (APT) family kinase protein
MSSDLQPQRRQAALNAYRAAFPDRQDVQVANWLSMTSGWENEMYSFDVEYGPPTARCREGLVLRVYPGDDAYAKSAHEFHHLRQIRSAGYPVPEVLLLERDASDKPFVIMERIEGHSLWPVMFHAPEGSQQALLSLFCELLVRLHRLDWQPFAEGVPSDVAGQPYFFVDQWLAAAHETLKRFPVAGFSPVVAWLEAHRGDVPCPRPSVIHGDFHPNNVLVRDDGSAVVIDWTNLSVSDARNDLAWTLLLVDSYEGRQWRGRVLDEYERLSGAKLEHLEYFDVMACARRLFDITVSLSQGAERLGMRAGAVTEMKQQARAIERVYSLLLERTGIRLAEVEDLLRAL